MKTCKAGKSVVILFRITNQRNLELLCAKSRPCGTSGNVKKTEMLV